jgi:hypothetical protein
MKTNKKSVNVARRVKSSLETARNEIERESRIEAERHLAQLENALANLCHVSNVVANTAIQLIMERARHVPPYTPLAGNAAKRYKEVFLAMTPLERRRFETWARGREEDARRGYGEATEILQEFYGVLTQLLTRTFHEADPFSLVGVGAWRILESYHPNLRFHQVKVKRKHCRWRSRN